MAISDRFYDLFQRSLRPILKALYLNRQSGIPSSSLEAKFEKPLLKLKSMNYVTSNEDGIIHLDTRVRKFFEAMESGFSREDSAWLEGQLRELKKYIKHFEEKENNEDVLDDLSKDIIETLRKSATRIIEHVSSIRFLAELDFRASGSAESKTTKLKMHTERLDEFTRDLSAFEDFLRNHAFFIGKTEREIIKARRECFSACTKVQSNQIDTIDLISRYLFKIAKDYQRTQKLIEIVTSLRKGSLYVDTNIEEVAQRIQGPWFASMRCKTQVDPEIIERRPDLIDKILKNSQKRKFVRTTSVKANTEDYEPDESIFRDWEEAYRHFLSQDKELLQFLITLSSEGEQLTEEEIIEGYSYLVITEPCLERHITSQELREYREYRYLPILPQLKPQYA